MQPKVLELCNLNRFSRILLEDDDDHTNDAVDDDDGDGDGDGDGGGDDDDDDDDEDDDDDDDEDDDDDDNDNDPVELFQKRGKWWELIVKLSSVLWRAVKEQQIKIEHLEASVCELQEAMKELYNEA